MEVRGEVAGEETRLEWVEKGVGGEEMEESHVNSTMGQCAPARMPEKPKITARVAGSSLKGSFLAIS